MTRTNKVVLGLFVLETLLVAACVKHAMNVLKPSAPVKLNAIIRLHVPGSGQFVCSGTVVSPTKIVSAAHCLGGIGMMTPFGLILPPKPYFDIRGQGTKGLGIIGSLLGYDPRSDQMVLGGDFKGFENLPLDTSPKGIIKSFSSPNSRLKACGYPYGGPLYCGPITDTKQYLFQFLGKGYLYPGMSGGPVINVDTGEVIAVNTAVTADEQTGETWVLLSPTLNIFDATNR